MFRTFGRLLIVASVTSLSPGALAADTESAQRCAEIENDSHRLACYDQHFGSPASTAQTAVATAPRGASVGENGVRDFGLSEADKRRNVNLPAAPNSISVTIQSVSMRPTGEQVFKTQEGQVWVELEPSSRLRVDPGETVTIRKAAIGSHLLVTADRVGVKVRRVN